METMTNDIDSEWSLFLRSQHEIIDIRQPIYTTEQRQQERDLAQDSQNNESENPIPICEELYISTNTKTLILNQEIDTFVVFWKIPIIEYWKPEEGVVHKHMKVVSDTPEQLELYKEYLSHVKEEYKEHIMKQIDIRNTKRPKFKDDRKIMVGISKKEIMNARKKQKKAFMNSFAIIIRLEFEGMFREIHVKIFNTGKMEIPGVPQRALLNIVKQKIICILQPHMPTLLEFSETSAGMEDKGVLINSNFRCGYHVNRENAYHILRTKYGIDSAYDSCSYPGVKSKFYFNNKIGFDTDKQIGRIDEEDRSCTIDALRKNPKYTEMTFTIFRTGSCLVSGNCCDDILYFVYNFLCKFLRDEYLQIRANVIIPMIKEKKIKVRKHWISTTVDYYNKTISKTTYKNNSNVSNDEFGVASV